MTRRVRDVVGRAKAGRTLRVSTQTIGSVRYMLYAKKSLIPRDREEDVELVGGRSSASKGIQWLR